jgi:hypothetical protein
MSIDTDLLAYCGLYCGTCPDYTQSIANLAKDLKKELDRCRLAKAAPAMAKIPKFKAFMHYEKFYALLETMMELRCVNPCKRGGGNPACAIKLCARKKRFEGCWQCKDFRKCEKLKAIEQFDDPVYAKNLRRVKRIGVEQFLKEKKLP